MSQTLHYLQCKFLRLQIFCLVFPYKILLFSNDVPLAKFLCITTITSEFQFMPSMDKITPTGPANLTYLRFRPKAIVCRRCNLSQLPIVYADVVVPFVVSANRFTFSELMMRFGLYHILKVDSMKNRKTSRGQFLVGHSISTKGIFSKPLNWRDVASVATKLKWLQPGLWIFPGVRVQMFHFRTLSAKLNNVRENSQLLCPRSVFWPFQIQCWNVWIDWQF